MLHNACRISSVSFMPFSRVSIMLHTQRLDRDRLVQFARCAEDAGLGGLWSVESSFDSLVMAHEMLAATKAITVGTGVAARWKRHPMQLAEAAGTLDHLYPGRFAIGVGSSSWVTDARRAWHQGLERPVARMREYVEVLKSGLTGEIVDYSGDFYDLYAQAHFEPGARVPVYVAGGGPQYCRLAGRHAEGLFLAAKPPHSIASLVSEFERSAAAAGRDVGGLRVLQVVPAIVGGSHQEARDRLRANLLEICLQDEQQQLALAEAGFESEVRKIRHQLAADDWDGAAEAVSDDVVELLGLPLALGDSAEEVRERISSVFASEATDIVLYPYSTTSTWLQEYERLFALIASLPRSAVTADEA